VGKAFVDYYVDLFSAGWEGALCPCLHKISNCVSDIMNMKLMAEFTMEEISAALNQMATLKATSPDGLNACFFQ
jgi:hypothetical protein